MKIKVRVAKPKTLKEKFFEILPNAPMNSKGTPYCCPYAAGLSDTGLCDNFNDCEECWSRLYKEAD